jgi:hypothetical protein
MKTLDDIIKYYKVAVKEGHCNTPISAETILVLAKEIKSLQDKKKHKIIR